MELDVVLSSGKTAMDETDTVLPSAGERQGQSYLLHHQAMNRVGHHLPPCPSAIPLLSYLINQTSSKAWELRKMWTQSQFVPGFESNSMSLWVCPILDSSFPLRALTSYL